MSKSTLFIAVECHQCSTMQVKQQKKSSNKWNCAVCNEKQSVRKVYAQGYQAKDIRQVVQSFNMSRKFADDRKCLDFSLGHFVEQLEGDHVVAEETGKKRSDWSEYVDIDEGNLEPAYLKSNLREAETFEQKVVTELPEELMFKKPRLKGNITSSSRNAGENQSYKPQFPKRSGARKEPVKNRAGTSDVPSAWNEVSYNVGDVDEYSEMRSEIQQKSKGVGMMKTGASKWAEYLTEDDGGYHCQADKAPFVSDGHKVETDDVDLLVEEDIHPDFL
ncbi:uncharacterized protein LOC141658805 [Silene latifolia]|uniref:uncharacterized protein LOC141658805 n=1 Tax=Silene latifolia TaxID=37657 RepID=UPI003D774629